MTEFFGSFYYYPIKCYLFITNYLYYKKFRVVGRENIPAKGPLIYAINHQNALLDALLISSVTIRDPHFLTRSDVFKSGLIDKILRGAKMLPIYRIRDGYNSVKMNAAIFDAACKILAKNQVVGIFPEGTDRLTYQLRPLKKGIARIAFMAEEVADFKIGVQIVPIGIQYESHFFAKRTLISFGKPMKVADYQQAYSQDKNKAMDVLVADLHDRIKKLMLTIEGKDYDAVYKEFMEKRVFKSDLTQQMEADQALIDAIEHGGTFNEVSDKKNFICKITDALWGSLWQVVSFIPKTIVDFLVKKTADQNHFTGTMRYVFTLFLYPIIFAILIWIICLVL